MKTKIFRLSFESPVHFGDKRLSDSNYIIHSDTLFSALYIEAIENRWDTSWLREDLLISDTFPTINWTFYLPKPLITIASKDEVDYKTFKNLKYIPSERFADYLEGKLNAETANRINNNFKLGKSHTDTKVNMMDFESEGHGRPYSIGSFIFNNDSGLFFVAKGSDSSLAKLEDLLYSLELSGIGGKRSSGYGRFVFHEVFDEALINLFNNEGQKKILISSAMSTEQELDDIYKNSKFILKKRSGFVQSSTYSDRILKKNNVYLFAAGSVFENTFKGEIINVGNKGNHPVYKYAKAMWLEVD